jgi:hypothetical protein
MQKKILELGHTNARQLKPIYSSFENNPNNNTTQNRDITYWRYRHGSHLTKVPEQLVGLTFE